MTLLVVSCALGVALLTAAGAAVAVWRVRAATDRRIAEAVQGLADGMHDTMRELAVSIEQAQTALRSERFVEELAASLDFDEVTTRTLGAVAALPGVDAAALDAPAPEAAGAPMVTGMDAAEAAGIAVPAPDNDNLRAVELSFRYRIDDVDAASGTIRSGVAVPLRAAGVHLGTLGAFTRSPARRISEVEIEEVERLAFRAGPALDNARRYAEARALADLDALTGLHNRRTFHETLAREVSRAHRYRRRLALVVIDLDDFKAINDRVGHLAGDDVLATAAERLRPVVRTTDIACRVGGDEFAVILPEAGARDAELLAQRIARAVSTSPVASAGTLLLSAGVAELREGDTANGLFERADQALYRAKELGKARTVAADGT
ncbi:MAG: diguanylate cyclase [Gaiellaceae bacterium]